MNQFIFDDNLKNVNEVKNIDIIFFSVSKRELLNKDYTRIEKNIKILNEAGKLAKGKMMLTFDIVMSGMAGSRQLERKNNIAANGYIDNFFDEYYPDEKLEQIYSNAKTVN